MLKSVVHVLYLRMGLFPQKNILLHGSCPEVAGTGCVDFPLSVNGDAEISDSTMSMGAVLSKNLLCGSV